MKIGYARVSSAGQSLDVQLEQLEAAGAERIFQEKVSGRSTQGRDELELALQTLRPGDILVVTKLDRLARSVADLHAIVTRVIEAGAAFTCLTQGGVDTTSSSGKLMLSILGAVAEFENDIRRERQAEGIARAKAEGRYKNRRKTPGAMNVPRIDRQAVKEKLFEGLGPTAIADELGIGRASVYRIEAELKEAGELDGAPQGTEPAAAS